MDLEEMKKGWSVLNERLQRNEILNKRLVKEMIEKRIFNAYQWLLYKNIIALTIYLLGLLLTSCAHYYCGTPMLVVYTIGAFLVFSTLLGMPMFVVFLRFDLEKPLKETFRIVLFYRKSMRICYPLIVALGTAAFLFVYFYYWNLETWGIRTAVFFITLVIALGGSVLEYRIDGSKLAALQKGLQDLKEFDEEDHSETSVSSSGNDSSF